MKKMLSRLGCNASTAGDGQQALDMILGSPAESVDERRTGGSLPSRGAYDVIFLDNQMPVLSGIALTERLRQMGRLDFIVGVTGNAMVSDVEEYKEAGANHVLTKPVQEKRLKTMLVLANERRKLQSPLPSPG